VGVRGVVRDVTARRVAEIALQKQNEEYRLLFESNPCPMYVLDERTLAFLAVNQSAINHYGYFARRVSQVVRRGHPDRLTTFRFAVVYRATTEQNDSAGVWKHQKKDGAIIEVDVSWHKLDFAGRPAYLVLANDITDQNARRPRLLKAKERYRELFENANDHLHNPIWPEFHFTKSNRPAVNGLYPVGSAHDEHRSGGGARSP